MAEDPSVILTQVHLDSGKHGEKWSLRFHICRITSISPSEIRGAHDIFETINRN